MGKKKKKAVLGLKFALVILCTFLLTVSMFSATKQSIVPSTSYDPNNPDDPHYQSNADPIDPSLITLEITSATAGKITGILHGDFIEADMFVYTDGLVSFQDMAFFVNPGDEWEVKGDFVGHTYVMAYVLYYDELAKALQVVKLKSAEFILKYGVVPPYYTNEDAWMPRPERIDWASGGVAGPSPPRNNKLGAGSITLSVEGGGYCSGILKPYLIDIKTGWFSDACFPIESVTLSGGGKNILTLVRTVRVYFVHEKEKDPNTAYAYYRKYESCDKKNEVVNGQYTGKTYIDWGKKIEGTKGEKFITIHKKSTETWSQAVEDNKPSGCWKSMGYTLCSRTYTDDEGNEYDPRDPNDPNYPDAQHVEFKVTGVYPSIVTFQESKIPKVGHISNCAVNADLKGFPLMGIGSATVGQTWQFYGGSSRQPDISIAGQFLYYYSTEKLIKIMSGEGTPVVTTYMMNNAPEIANALLCEGMPDSRGTDADIKSLSWMSIAEVNKKIGPVEVYQSDIAPNKMKLFGNSIMGMDIDSSSTLFNFWDALQGISIILWLLTLIMFSLTIVVFLKL